MTKHILYLMILLGTLMPGQVVAKGPPAIPYYGSIQADEANVRTGPSVRYPIQWVYKRKNWPVEVTATFEGWRKIRDINGEAGWIHESMVSLRRYVVIQSNGAQEIYRLPVVNSAAIVIAENGVVADLISCKSDWCKIKVGGEKGWVRVENLWGVTPGQDVD